MSAGRIANVVVTRSCVYGVSRIAACLFALVLLCPAPGSRAAAAPGAYTVEVQSESGEVLATVSFTVSDAAFGGQSSN